MDYHIKQKKKKQLNGSVNSRGSQSGEQRHDREDQALKTYKARKEGN